MEFDETKENDPNYLIEWYNYKISIWRNKPESQKIVKKYEEAIKRLSGQIRVDALK